MQRAQATIRFGTDDVSGERAADTHTPPMIAAAQSMVAQGVSHTVADVLHARAFRHYEEAVRQYLAVRHASVDRARTSLQALRAAIGTWSAERLVAPPGPRAQIFRMAHVTAQNDASEVARGALPWRYPEAGGAQLIATLAPEDAELLELRHGRTLDVGEIAFVVGREPSSVARRLDEIEGTAAAVLTLPPDAELGSRLSAAFALEPETSTEGVPAISIPLGTLIGNRYTLAECVGAGAFGEVFRADDTEVPGHVVALKILHQPSVSEEARAAAIRELRVIASVFHPSIVTFKDNGWHDGRFWFVMPWYEGESLESRIARKPLSRRQARVIFEPLARALATMHASGIRHQDIKPDNVFLSKIRGFAGVGGSGEEEQILPVLIDLGVAAKEAEMLLAGTPTYFAPEVAAQFARIGTTHPVTTKADVFSLALTVRNALEPETQEEVVAGAVERFVATRAAHAPEPPEGSDLRYLAPTFRRWLHPDPDMRPTAEQLADELVVLTEPEERRERRSRLLRWLVPLILSFMAIVGALALVLVREKRAAVVKEAALTGQVMGARESLAQAEARQRDLEQHLSAVSAQATSGELSREQLSREIARTTRMVRELRGDVQRAERAERLLRDRAEKAEGNVAAFGIELAQARAALDGERSRALRLSQELAQRNADLQQRQAELDRAGRDLTARIAEVEFARARAESNARDLAGAREQIAELERREQAVRVEVENARADAAQARRDVEDMRRERDRLASQNDALRTPPGGVQKP